MIAYPLHGISNVCERSLVTPFRRDDTLRVFWLQRNPPANSNIKKKSGTVKEHNLNPFDFWEKARTCRARCAVIFSPITQHRASSGAPKIKRRSLNDNNFSTDGYFKEIPEQRKVGLFFTRVPGVFVTFCGQKVKRERLEIEYTIKAVRLKTAFKYKGGQMK